MMRAPGFLSLFLIIAFSSAAYSQRPDPNSPRFKAVQAIRAFVELGQMTAEEFANRHMAATTMDQNTRDATLEQLKEIKAALGSAEATEIEVTSPRNVQMVFEGGSKAIQLNFELDASEPHRISEISIKPLQESTPQNPPLTWENLDERLQREADEGWAGAILIVRDGQVVIERAFGMADHDKQVKNTPETIFAIGSTPIDFTNAAILQLAENGHLRLTDPITKFFDDVPQDKQSITIEQLMSGRSGLQNFHDVPGDANPDHTWIDRDEAIRRIFAQNLRFEPGQGRAHSHSAFGVLAAIVEIVSGQTYQEYTTEKLFLPNGMKDTGFFGQPLPEQRAAVGIGEQSSGKINSPPHWGKTSWLVVGSGGQVSTVGDMNRWIDALHSGKVVSQENISKITGPGSGLAVGGDMFGFEIFYSQHPESRMILTSNNVNSRERRSRMRQMARDLHALITPQNRYSLGIEMNVGSETGVSIRRVVSGSAAEQFGLKAGDRLISANGRALMSDPMAVLDPLLQIGDPIEFEIERDKQKLRIKVVPSPRRQN